MRELGQSGATAVVEAYLGWWDLAGVDCAVSEAPVNWLRAPQASSLPQNPRPDPLPSAGRTLPEDFPAFLAWLSTDADQPEAAWPGPRIMPSGAEGAALMVLCDTPDADDLATGHLLSGAPGTLFDAILGALGMKRESVHVASLATARPPGGIIGEKDMARLAERVRHHVMLARPERLLVLGERTSRVLTAAKLLSSDGGLRQFNHQGGTVSAVATFHPRLLLRQPAAKAEAWRILQLLIEDART